MVFFLMILASLLTPMFGYVLVYVARCYSIVLTESSSGIDHVRWPKDRFTEWVGDAWLVLLILVCLVGLTAVMTTPFAVSVDEEWQAYVILGLDALFLWLVFPIAICTAHHPVLIAALPRRIVPMIRVWGMTTPLAAVAGFGIGLTLRGYLAGPYVVALVRRPGDSRPCSSLGPIRLARTQRTAASPAKAAEERLRTRGRGSDRDPRRGACAAPRAVRDDEAAYVLKASDWTPEPGHLAEHYEIQRERERWKRLKAGQDTIDAFERPKPPKPRTALAASKIFGVLLDANTAAVALCIGIALAFVAAVCLAAQLAI